MKSLLKYGVSDCLGSLMPILFWMLMGVLFGSDCANGFILGYPLQFVFGLMYSILVVGSLKYELKQDDKCNYFGAGMVCFIVIGFFFMTLCHIFIGSVSLVFNFTDPLSKQLFLVCGYLLVADWLVCSIAKKEQYIGKPFRSFSILIGWFSERFLALLAVRFIAVSRVGVEDSLWFYTLVCCLSAVVKVCYYVSFCKLRFKILNFIKYSSYSIGSNLGMFAVYTLGVRQAVGDWVFLSAYNAMSLCTDTQWDMLSSVDTYTTKNAVSSNWSDVKSFVFKNSILYGVVLVVSSYVILFCYSFTLADEVVFNAFKLMSIELSVFILHTVSCVISAYLQIAYPSKILIVISFLKYALRLITQVSFLSLFGISYAVISACSFEFIVLLVLYLVKMRESTNNDKYI